MTPENQQAFERSLEMLDRSINEMRKVAYYMMPEVLVTSGLNAALAELCADIHQTGALHIAYQSTGMENAQIDQTTSITIYRIVQELINNTIKHAAATNITVQLHKTGERLSIAVEDDGKGFDISTLDKTKGTGWENIVNKINFLNGTINIDSEKGRGTSVLIALNV